MNDRIIASRL